MVSLSKRVHITLDDDTAEILKQVAGKRMPDKIKGVIAAYLNEHSFTKTARKNGT